MDSGIYVITNKINNKRYIGRDSYLSKKNRWGAHKRDLRKGEHGNPYFQNEWNKYGEENFQFNEIEFCEKSLLNERETYWVDFYKTNLREFGYNLNEGGGGVTGYKHTPETKKRISENISKSRKGIVFSDEHRRNISNALKGKTIPPEVREKISQAGKGRTYTEEEKKKRSDAMKRYWEGRRKSSEL